MLDLGCGRGLLLEHLRESKGVTGLGFDLDLEKPSLALPEEFPLIRRIFGRDCRTLMMTLLIGLFFKNG